LRKGTNGKSFPARIDRSKQKSNGGRTRLQRPERFMGVAVIVSKFSEIVVVANYE